MRHGYVRCLLLPSKAVLLASGQTLLRADFHRSRFLFSSPADSYDYDIALTKVLPQIVSAHRAKGGMLVLRPDSGDPVDCIIKALEAGEKSFGCSTNALGYKVLNGVSAIQGDGINFAVAKEILKATLERGYSAQNVAFGMGHANTHAVSGRRRIPYLIYLRSCLTCIAGVFALFSALPPIPTSSQAVVCFRKWIVIRCLLLQNFLTSFIPLTGSIAT